MVTNAEQSGTAVTVGEDPRITKAGRFLRKTRLDELPQLIDVLEGTMTFVGTRPEAVRYVEHYTPAMRATLLLPAGITSEASILYKDEAELLENAEDADRTYIEEILPAKMEYNLQSIRNFSLLNDLRTMIATVGAVLK
jgi:lipopolysaccharide/colanic/teichoic acid biosynthesis glycosyltransferase